MAPDKHYLDYAMDLLTPIGGVKSRAMFGRYGIFHESDMFALISGSSLYFKVDETNRSRYEQAGGEQFKPMPYFQVPADVLGDVAVLQDWARVSIAIAHSTAMNKKRRYH